MGSVDPQRLGLQRRSAARQLRLGYSKLKVALVRELLKPGLVHNSYAFGTAEGKLARFRGWLRERMGTDLRGRQVVQEYVRRAYLQGRQRSRQDTQSRFNDLAYGVDATVRKVEFLASRALHELEGVDAQSAVRISRLMADGLVTGMSAKAVARAVAAETDLTYGRAYMVVSTEMSRAHAEGQLDALESAGVDGAELEAEWQAADTACSRCSAMDGRVVPLAQARGLIPLHPNCKCAWAPASVTANMYVQNVFCPTGEGGGVDPTCGAHSGRVGKAEHVRSGEIEREVASAVRAQWEEDNLPYDAIRPGHSFEIKSFLIGKGNSITVHPDALMRKVVHAAESGHAFHTVLVDDRAEYQQGAHASKYSGNRLYYRRGCGEGYGASNMHPVASYAELRRLVDMHPSDLPAKAQGALPSGDALKTLQERATAAHASRLAKDRRIRERLRELKRDAEE